MVSPESEGCLHVVQVTYAGGVREHVADTECDGFDGAHDRAKRLRRWLSYGPGWGLTAEQRGLRDELERAGIGPADAEVAVVRLDRAGPGRWDCNGEVLCVVDVWAAHADDDDAAECEDTVLVVEGR